MSIKKIAPLVALLIGVAVGVFVLLRKPGMSPQSAGAPSAVPPVAPPAAATTMLTVYSGRNEKLVGSLFTAFEKQSGIQVQVRYGETPQLAAMLLEEGERSPADVYLAQDAGALGALAKAGRFTKLPDGLLARVADERFRSAAGEWVGLSGRARVLAYSTKKVKPTELPRSVRELTKPEWKKRVGWAPTNASFQAFVTALRTLEGEDAAAKWLDGMRANEPRAYKNNSAIVEALARGEVDVGLVNHYYVFAAEKGRKEPLGVENHYFSKDDPGALINVAGVGILRSSMHPEAAQKLVEFLLGTEAQTHFAKETYEYPLSASVPLDARLKPIGEVGSPKLDLSRLDALQGTVRLLQEKAIL
jgi:iron(III) transport system substrate-binding protein